MKMAKNSRSSIPSTRVSTDVDVASSVAELPMARSARDERSTSGSSLVITERSTAMGRIMAVTPMMTSMLKRLDPTTLPIASPADPLMADMTEMTSSGADVPKATTVSPTMRSEMPNRRAMAAEPSVSQLAPKSMSARPMMRYTMSSIIVSGKEY